MLRRSWPGVYSKSQRNAVNCEVEGLPCSRAPQKTGQRKNHQRKIHKQQSFSLQYLWNFMTVFFGCQAILLGNTDSKLHRIEQTQLKIRKGQIYSDCCARSVKSNFFFANNGSKLLLVIFMASSFLLMPRKTIKTKVELDQACHLDILMKTQGEKN